jgi:hypothetical protein
VGHALFGSIGDFSERSGQNNRNVVVEGLELEPAQVHDQGLSEIGSIGEGKIRDANSATSTRQGNF